LTVLPYDNLTDVIEGEDSMALLTRANALIPVRPVHAVLVGDFVF